MDTPEGRQEIVELCKHSWNMDFGDRLPWDDLPDRLKEYEIYTAALVIKDVTNSLPEKEK
ncbi:MAG: hypothetical protein ACPGO7_02765 [Alphaproteobacteria bacterium]